MICPLPPKQNAATICQANCPVEVTLQIGKICICGVQNYTAFVTKERYIGHLSNGSYEYILEMKYLIYGLCTFHLSPCSRHRSVEIHPIKVEVALTVCEMFRILIWFNVKVSLWIDFVNTFIIRLFWNSITF